MASLFAATTVAGGVLRSSHARPDQQVSSDVYYFARQVGWMWIVMLFPLWTILVSVHILAAQRKPKGVKRKR